jgi:Holliday junction resolvase
LINVAKKGYRGEVEVLGLFEHLNIPAMRSWGSDGRSMMSKSGKPHKSDVDIVAEIDGWEMKVQVKRRKKLPAYLQFRNCDLVATRQDRGQWVYILRESTFKRLLKGCVS